MNEEEILNQLWMLNDELDLMLKDVEQLEHNNPQPPTYFAQILKTLKKPVKTACEGEEVVDTACQGATSSCELQNDSDYVAIADMSIKIDGVLYTQEDELPPIVRFAAERRPVVQGTGYGWQYYVVLENLTDQLIRIELINYRGGGAGLENQNPTLKLEGLGSGTVCLAPRTPCLPTLIPQNELADPQLFGTQTLYYRINQNQVKSVQFNPDGFMGFDTLLSRINDVEGTLIFAIGGGGGLAAFNYYDGLYGAVGDGTEPTTIILLDLEDSSVVQSVFGVPLIELHACGFENFPGF